MKKLLIFFVLLKVFVIPLTAGERIVHAFVALCDNEHQGIVRVPAALGNGDNLRTNLYWGAGAGLKTFFKRSRQWKLIYFKKNINNFLLERVVFKYKNRNIYLVADAFRGKNMAEALMSFFNANAGRYQLLLKIKNKKIKAGSAANLMVFIGHNGLMDVYNPAIFKIVQSKNYPLSIKGKNVNNVLIFSCISKHYFKEALIRSNSYPLVWTKALLAPEAYILEGALEGWIRKESSAKIVKRTAQAYARYQKCSYKGARRIFTTGW